MKEILFTKDESKFLKECLQYKITGLRSSHLETIKQQKECERLIKKFERAEKTIKVSSRKGKGRGLQYWVCERIAKMFSIDFIQSDDTCLVHSREMGQHGTDIIVRGEIYNKFPFDVECKAQENLNIPEWVRQARENNKKDGRDWLVVFKKQTIGGDPLVIMDWNCFEKLVKKSYNSIEDKK